mmetsp:Transcript_16767/g.36457  ORF Transcript_16767/g.36457 Transcript_16767/m.36457 type:complete len:310 (+) Transcript_16767:1602-2531(+)
MSHVDALPHHCGPILHGAHLEQRQHRLDDVVEVRPGRLPHPRDRHNLPWGQPLPDALHGNDVVGVLRPVRARGVRTGVHLPREELHPEDGEHEPAQRQHQHDEADLARHAQQRRDDRAHPLVPRNHAERAQRAEGAERLEGGEGAGTNGEGDEGEEDDEEVEAVPPAAEVRRGLHRARHPREEEAVGHHLQHHLRREHRREGHVREEERPGEGGLLVLVGVLEGQGDGAEHDAGHHDVVKVLVVHHAQAHRAHGVVHCEQPQAPPRGVVLLRVVACQQVPQLVDPRVLGAQVEEVQRAPPPDRKVLLAQ